MTYDLDFSFFLHLTSQKQHTIITTDVKVVFFGYRTVDVTV